MRKVIRNKWGEKQKPAKGRIGVSWLVSPAKKAVNGLSSTRETIVDDAYGLYSKGHVVATVAMSHPNHRRNSRLLQVAPEMEDILLTLAALDHLSDVEQGREFRALLRRTGRVIDYINAADRKR